MLHAVPCQLGAILVFTVQLYALASNQQLIIPGNLTVLLHEAIYRGNFDTKLTEFLRV